MTRPVDPWPHERTFREADREAARWDRSVLAEANAERFREPRLRLVCAWHLPAPIPMDGLGPIVEGDAVSHGLCEACAVREMGEVGR